MIEVVFVRDAPLGVPDDVELELGFRDFLASLTDFRLDAIDSDPFQIHVIQVLRIVSMWSLNALQASCSSRSILVRRSASRS